MPRHRLAQGNDVSAVDVGGALAAVGERVVDGARGFAGEAPLEAEVQAQTHPELGAVESVPKYPWSGGAVQIAGVWGRNTEREKQRPEATLVLAN